MDAGRSRISVHRPSEDPFIASDSSTIARQAERNLKGAVENCEDFMKTTGVLDVEIDFIKKNLLQ